MKTNKYQNATENKLVELVLSKTDDLAMRELLDRHLDIVNSVIHKFYRKNQNLNLFEMLEDKYIIFNDAVKSFNSTKKTKFTSWLYLVTRYHLLNTNKKAELTSPCDHIKIDIINNNNGKFCSHGEQTQNHNNSKYIFHLLNQIKDKRIADIFKMRYFDESGKSITPWKDIANKINLSIPRVISLHKRGKDMIYKKFMSERQMDSL